MYVITDDYGPFRSGEKVVYKTIFFHHEHLKMQMVCHDLTNFGRSGQIFERSADKFAPIV